MSNRLMQNLASMAERMPLRALYNLCDSQKQVSTGKLREYLDHAGDTLAGYAATLRHEFDRIAIADPAAPVAQAEQEPVAWMVRRWVPGENPSPWHVELKRPERPSVEFRPLYAAPPAHPDADEWPPCDYCGAQMSYHPWHGSGMFQGKESPHIHACCECRHLLPHPDASVLVEALDHIGGLCRALRVGGPDPMDLEGLSDALNDAVDTAHEAIKAYDAALAGKGGE